MQMYIHNMTMMTYVMMHGHFQQNMPKHNTNFQPKMRATSKNLQSGCALLFHSHIHKIKRLCLPDQNVSEIYIFQIKKEMWTVIIPPQTKFGGYTGMSLSVCPSVRPSVCLSVDRILCAQLLLYYCTNFFQTWYSYWA